MALRIFGPMSIYINHMMRQWRCYSFLKKTLTNLESTSRILTPQKGCCMNTTICLDFDDQEVKADRNGMNYLLYWKSKYPKLKVNMFAIPGRMTVDFIKLLDPYRDWIDLLVHGFRHDDNFEVLKWDTNTANIFLQRAENMGFSKIFKAPGWQITYPQPYNETPDQTKPVNSSPQLVYNVLMERGYKVADQHYNREKRPEGLL